MGICALTMFLVTNKVSDLRMQSRSYQQDLHNFYRLSQELKQSSDHLTKFARAYVVTGDDYWEELFNLVLAIRNGDIPIPSGNEYEYWDLVANSASYKPDANQPKGVPLLVRLRESGIGESEFLELKGALTLSDELVDIEREAFLAVKGITRQDDGREIDTGEPNLAYA